jgi:acylaminoacyl-peptidase
VTSGAYDHGETPSWSADGEFLVFSANRHADWEYDPVNTEIYEVSVADGSIQSLTDRQGPDTDPAVSPDAKQIAYLGFDDELQGYQITRLYVMNRDGSDSRSLTGDLDRRVDRPIWSHDGRGIYFEYDDQGDTKIGYVSLGGHVETLAQGIGGTSFGRLYPGRSFSVAGNARFPYTQASPERPADLAVGRKGSPSADRITGLNEDLFGHKELGEVEEVWCESSYDGREIHGWVITRFRSRAEVSASIGDSWRSLCELWTALCG